MKRLGLFIAPVLALLAASHSAAAQDVPPENPLADPVDWVSQEDQAMNAAIAKAQASLPEWLELLENQPQGYTRFIFKFPLDGYEHIWVSDVTREGDVLSGRLANTPHAPGWQRGQRVYVKLEDVSDWAYRDEKGVAHGYHTVRVLFGQMDPKEAAQLRASFGWEDESK